MQLPHASHPTTPLGIGMATLMREPSPAKQQRLLAAAYDAGFRHFDVAPSYGLGAAEAALGRFLKTRPAGVTVATKVGILPRGNSSLMQAMQRPARALIRRFPALRGRAMRAVGAAVHTTPDFSPATRAASVERSLRALGVETIDLLLLHEARPENLADGALVEWLETLRARGLVRDIGVATTAANAARAGQRLDALQFPSSVLEPTVASVTAPGTVRITHSVLAGTLAAARARAAADRDWTRRLAERADIDTAPPWVVPQLILACALRENSGGIVLLGTSSEAHIRRAPHAINAFTATQLDGAAAYFRSTLRP